MDERDCDGGFQSTSLMKAARHDQPELVAASLECTATNIDAVGADGCTALILAACQGHLRVVRALMDAGANLSCTDTQGRTAAEAAEAFGYTSVATAIRAEERRREELWATLTGEARARPPTTIEALLSDAGAVPSRGGPKESPF